MKLESVLILPCLISALILADSEHVKERDSVGKQQITPYVCDDLINCQDICLDHVTLQQRHCAKGNCEIDATIDCSATSEYCYLDTSPPYVDSLCGGGGGELE